MTKPLSLLVGAALAALSTGCISEPEPGEYGNFRYFGNVRGAAPLPFLPPISDRAGNVYVLYGDLNLLELELFIGHAGGGWTGGCGLSQGNDYGVHGFVGRAQQRAWYWSGTALVGVSGLTGSCGRVLEFDPSSGARLDFRAIVPWVREAPSLTTTVAWIQAFGDPAPFVAVIDLDRSVYTSLSGFEPASATEVVVLGTGAHLENNESLVVARYNDGGSLRVQAFFYDLEGELLDRVDVPGLETLPEYGILGYLQPDDTGLFAGLTSDGRLVLIDREGAEVRGVSSMTPVGVHHWEDQLFLVGVNGNSPRVARIDEDGDVVDEQQWDASLEANSIGSSIDVIDDRSLPSTEVTWDDPVSAMAVYPFVHSHSLDHYADGTTTWLVAGPSFSVGGQDFTAVAMAPVGISYED